MMASLAPLTSGVRSLREQDRGADGRMAGEGQLALRREDAHARRVRRVLRLQHEDRLGQVQLARDRLHLLGVERIGIADDGQRIAAEAAIGEDVERVQRQRHASIIPLRPAHSAQISRPVKRARGCAARPAHAPAWCFRRCRRAPRTMTMSSSSGSAWRPDVGEHARAQLVGGKRAAPFDADRDLQPDEGHDVARALAAWSRARGPFPRRARARCSRRCRCRPRTRLRRRSVRSADRRAPN